MKMLNLHDRAWKEFYIKDIFSISPGKRLTKSDMIIGNKPFIGATDSNNGVTAFVSNTIYCSLLYTRSLSASISRVPLIQ